MSPWRELYGTGTSLILGFAMIFMSTPSWIDTFPITGPINPSSARADSRSVGTVAVKPIFTGASRWVKTFPYWESTALTWCASSTMTTSNWSQYSFGSNLEKVWMVEQMILPYPPLFFSCERDFANPPPTTEIPMNPAFANSSLLWVNRLIVWHRKRILFLG